MKKVVLSLALLCSGSCVYAEITEKEREVIASASEKISNEMLRRFVGVNLVQLVQDAELSPEERAKVRELAVCLAGGRQPEDSNCAALIAAFLYNDSAHEIVEYKVPVAMLHIVEEAKRAQELL